MSEQNEKLTIQEAHLKFAKMCSGQTWDLLAKGNRTLEEEESMIHAAHASLYHWIQFGTVVNRQRGEYMLARAYAAAGLPVSALRHALRCVQLNQDHPDEMKDFDLAFAYECLARAHACAGNAAEAMIFLKEALDAGDKISAPEDKNIFLDELAGGDWFGVK